MMRCVLAWGAGAVLAAALVPVTTAAEPTPAEPTPAEQAGMAEYWRHAPRYGCLCCSVSIPAPKAAAVPGEIGSQAVLEPRVYENKARLNGFCTADPFLWTADDLAVYQIDARRRTLVRTYRAADGLPDVPVRQLVADGKWLWIVGRSRLSRLEVSAGRIDVPNQPPFTLARMATGPAGTFLVTEKGAYRWDAAANRFESLGAYPGQSNVARAVQRGFWQFQWHKHVSSLLRDVVVGQGELYVLAGNTLSRHDAAGRWVQIAQDAWRMALDEPHLWAVTTAGLLHYHRPTEKVTRYAGGSGPTPGKPVNLAVAGGAAYLVAEPRFDGREKRYTGGGVSRFDPAAGKWTTVQQVGGADVAFTPAVAVDGSDVLVSARLVGEVEHRSLHPGMANVREHIAKVTGLGVAVGAASGDWRLLRLQGIDGGPYWVMGQQKKHRHDRVRPQQISHVVACGDRLWAALRNFPETYYGGYYPTVQCIARRTEAGWTAVAERPRAESVGLAGDQPGILCLTATHRKPIVLGHGFPKVLGLFRAAGTVWLVQEGGVYAYDAAKDAFQAVLTEGFRAYWQVTAGACDASAAWFGTDAGTITRYDRKTRRFHLLGVVPGRKIDQVRVGNGKVCVRTANPKTRATLPAGLSDLAQLPPANVLCYDGHSWSAAKAEEMPAASPTPYAFPQGKKGTSNFLTGAAHGSDSPKRLAYLRGVFQPQVLCQDASGALWLGVWGGVARLALPDSMAAQQNAEPEAAQ